MTEEEKKYDGDVIWYNERRGYGFVRFEKDEIFLHTDRGLRGQEGRQ